MKKYGNSNIEIPNETSMEGVVPMCLYKKTDTGESFIGLPNKIRKGDQTVFECEDRTDSELVRQFYVINPDMRPIPPGTELFCALNAPDDMYCTTDIKIEYDPYNISEGCTRFIAWNDPAPYTTPLYLTKYGDTMWISFDKTPPSQNYKPLSFSPIHVLTDPRDGLKTLEGVDKPRDKSKDTFSVVNNIPFFRFSDYHGRCVPDPKGVSSMGECVMKTIINGDVQGQPTMLNYLNSRYGKYLEKSRGLSFSFSKNGKSIYFLIFLVIFIFIIIKWRRKD